MKLKVCGMKHNPEAVARLGPDYLGFILWEGSPRNFTGTLPAAGHEEPVRVGVFVDADPQEILRKSTDLSLGLVQLHGSESAEVCRQVRDTLSRAMPSPPGLIKAFQIDGDFDFEQLAPYRESCDYFLFDSRGPMPGGNGTRFDWKVLERYPYTKPFFLSGGIGPAAGKALTAFRDSAAARYCHAIDVNSRFEIAPGEKNIEALKQFMDSGVLTPGSKSQP